MSAATPNTDLDACCATIVRQSELLRTHVRNADLTVPVPTCPGWTLGHLLRHVTDAHSWAERIVRTRATSPDHLVDEAGGPDDEEDPAALADRLAEGAARLAVTLRAAGPNVQVWAPAPPRTPLFWARRTAVESTVHRYDATHALGLPYDLATEAAVIGLEEWTSVGALPQAFPSEADRHALLGPGRTVHLHATDVGQHGAGEWLIDLTGEDIAVRRSHEKAAVAVRAPAADLLLLMYGRRTPADGGIEVLGDAELFESWRLGSGDWSRRK